MEKNKNGFAPIIAIILVVIAALAISGGVYYVGSKKNSNVVDKPQQTQDKEDGMIVATSSAPEVAEEAVKPVAISATKTQSAITPAQPAVIPTKKVDEIVIYGKAAKGTILNAKIRAVEMINGKSGTFKEVEIGPNGDFSVSMPKGIILLRVITRKGSIEKDEVVKVDVPLPLGFKFRAAVDIVDETHESVMVNITAYSEAAVVLAEKNGGLLAKNINMANSGIANILGVDFIATKIIELNDPIQVANATEKERKMFILNGAIAKMASTDVMGCGAKQTYGETINCTIAKFADQFTLTSTPSAVHLGDVGYNAMIREMARFKEDL